MLKSFTLTPSNDILSYKDHKEYPFILFPTVIFTYRRRHILRLDQKDLSLLYHVGPNTHDSIKNTYTFNFHSLNNPLKILLEKPSGHEILNYYKFSQLKYLLPFSININLKIIKYIQTENISWKLTKKRTFRSNSITIQKYTDTNETEILIRKLKHINKHLDLIVYGEFEKQSFIPHNVKVIHVYKMNTVCIPIINEGTRLLYFVKNHVKKQILKDYEDESDENTSEENEELFLPFS